MAKQRGGDGTTNTSGGAEYKCMLRVTHGSRSLKLITL
jgi:hypothetical protein